MYEEINNKINELIKTGKYNESQIEAIKYACYLPNFDANIILDSSISSNCMLTYVKLATTNNIDVSKYINDKWHLKGFNDQQLYYLIFYDNKGYDISQINSNMSVDEIKEFMNNMIAEKEKEKLLSDEKNINNSQIELLKEYNLDINIIKFFLNQIDLGYDISIFLKPDIKDFSLEQIKYLFSVYSVGTDIEAIFNPNLSVEQMREKVLSSSTSIEFMQEIIESNNVRKSK